MGGLFVLQLFSSTYSLSIDASLGVCLHSPLCQENQRGNSPEGVGILFVRVTRIRYALRVPQLGGGTHIMGCTRVMHGRSRMAVDPRIPAMPGRSTSGAQRPGRHCLHQARSAVRCLASRMKGELYPAKNRLRGEVSCVWMTASN